MNTPSPASSSKPRGRRRRQCFSLACAILAFFAVMPGGWTRPQQYLVGPTPAATLRNAAAATDTQANILIKAAYDWGRRAGWANYGAAQFQPDFAYSQMQFWTLRQHFNAAGNLALQSGRARANNAVAELDAGLNTIAELYSFLQEQFNAGTLDNKTLVRTCRVLEDAMKVWQRELKKNSSRIGLTG